MQLPPQKCRALLSQFIEHAPAPIAMFDRDMKYIMASRRFAADYNLKSQDLIGRSHYEVFPEIPERWKEIHRRCLAGATERAEEDPFLRADGTLDWVRWEIQPWYDESGAIGGIILFSEVVTERKQAEAALHASERQYQMLADNLVDVIYRANPDTLVASFVNTAIEKLYGYTVEEWLRDPELWERTISPEDKESVLRYFRHARQQGADSSLEYRIIRKDEQPRWVTDRFSWERDATGRIIALNGVMSDITERKLAEEALQKSEQMLFTVLETAAFAVALTSLPDGMMVYVNHSFEHLFGFTKQEVIGKTSLELGIHRDPEARVRGLATLQEHPSMRDLELTLYMKSGESRICSVNLDVVEIRGQPYLLSTTQDITARKRAEEAQRDSERRYHEFVAGLPVAAYATDVTGRITLYNNAAVALWGRQPEPGDRWWGGSSKLYTPDGAILAYRQCPMAIAVREHRAIQGFEAVFERPDGTRVDILANITPAIDDSDRVLGATNVLLDITVRKRSGDALRESEERFRQLTENIREVFWMTDPSQNRILYVSPAYEEIWGRSTESLYASPNDWAEAIQPEDRGRVLEAIQTKQASGIYNEVYRIVRPDGTHRWIRDRAFPIRDASGTVYRIAGIAEDITELKQLEAQFFQSQKLEAVGELAGGIAHDFNNNLSAILGFSDLALDRLRPEDPIHRYLTQVKKAGEQSASLTRQLLAFSRKQLLQPKVLDLNVLIMELQMMLQRMIGENIELRLLLHPELGRVKADPGQVEQVLMNLAVNARDAMPEGGTLTLQTGNVECNEAEADARPAMLAGSYVRLTVSDTGCGMDATTQTRIFEPFFTTKELGKGTGLGLSTVYGIVKQSGGYIWVDSTLGQGTTFTIDLPRVEAPLEAASAIDVSMPSRRRVATILLVDDDEMVRTIARETLQAQGHTVLEALNAGGALLITERHHGAIDLLLTDVVMPYMSGPELAQRLTTQRPDMRVLYMSGYTDDMLAPHGVLQPGIAFLAKPFTPDGLLRKVQEVLNGAV